MDLFNLFYVITCVDIVAAPKSINKVFLGGKLLFLNYKRTPLRPFGGPLYVAPGF